MKVSPIQRESIRMMFGGRCAYCGCELNGSWHVDHVEAVKRDGKFVRKPGAIFATWKTNGKLRKAENDRLSNLWPSCVKCNILKAAGTIEDLRATLSYFAASIPTIRSYSHVHHLMRFGKIAIDTTPVVFWFERFRDAQRD